MNFQRLGSLEGDVVPFVMGLPVTNNVPALGGQQYISPWSSIANFSKQDGVVAETLVQYASNFVKNGYVTNILVDTLVQMMIHYELIRRPTSTK